MLDRTIAPAFVKSPEVNLKEAEHSLINQKIPFHFVTGSTQEVSKVEFVFNGGKWFEQKNGVAFFTVNMLREGTHSFNSKAISEKLDHYGAYLELASGFDYSYIGLYCLNKYLHKVLPIVAEIIYAPSFPEKQLELLKEIELQHLKIDLKKSSYRAQRIFREAIFGKNIAYGTSLHEHDLKSIATDDIFLHHQQNYKNFEIFASGKFDPAELTELLEQHFSEGNKINISKSKTEESTFKYNPQKISREENGSLQSSLRIGFPFIAKNHEDFISFRILNHLFGGYFGSRLMRNIREDKGYTYGIYSSVIPLRNASYFNIGADVIKESADDAIYEITKELKKLKEEPIPEEELQTVKNHLVGTFQSDLTSPFSLMDRFKSLYLHDLDYSFYERYFETLEEITSKNLQELANKYFDEDKLSIINVS